uniref:MORN repeat-containing protein 3 n=1 Tax=Phallusia mammillata TaxID=59560 RepID=A0A6F9DKD1_9ASCI|nr:MORN repeat-containing protein 3-like [Phallusia mammillata]
MPHVSQPKLSEPLWHSWDYKAQKKGLRHTVYSVNGDEFTGEWLDNKKHGKGTYKWKSTGGIYDGDWKNGKRNGFGTLSFPDKKAGKFKKQYSGGWKNDMKHGYGTFFYNDVEYYEGEWFADNRCGWGRMYFADGSVYEGEWDEDKCNGRGMLKLDNENRYEGEWKGGKKNGRGQFFYLDTGQLYEGVWVDDVPKCGAMTDFGRDGAPEPTVYPIPKVELVNSVDVLSSAEKSLLSDED